ncbi:MAG: putative Ig domain-containing protein, partial [Candidatus Omnitrophica bacterium]|nr:putative Ig domain-containing protein [Candidatus Omnitrophota bacterium]
AWQRITIPVTDFGRNLAQLESPFMITAPDAAVFYIDGVRWQDPLALNVVPVINSYAVVSALSDRQYTYDVNASDGNFDRLLYSLTTAPAGMTIDTLNGKIQWAPTPANEGVHPIVVTVNDGQGGIATQSFNLTLAATLSPSQYLHITPSYVLPLSFYNEWGTGVVTFGATSITMESQDFAGWGFFLPASDVSAAAPMAMHLTVETTADLVVGIEDTTASRTVQISDYGWNGLPNAQQIVIPIVDFEADLANLISPLHVTMEVVGTYTVSNAFWAIPGVTNSPPVITSTPVTTVGAPSTYVYDVDANDPDGDNLLYSLIVSPTNMGIDPNSGLILWLTEVADVGSHPVTVQVSDGNGGTDQQSFTVDVSNTSILYGDANEDGLVTSIDASQAARHAVQLITLSAQGQINAEVSGDGNITSIDASQIARFVVSLITCFPVEPSCP